MLKTSSPVYLCFVNQLLHEYYQSFNKVDPYHVEFLREHLKLINQVAYTVPESEREELINSIKNYIKQFDKNGNVIFQALRESINRLLKNQTIKIKQETLDPEEKKTKIERELKQLANQIETAKSAEPAQGLTLKSLLIRSLEGKKEKLSELLKRIPKQKSKAERDIIALENPLCSDGKTRYKILNEDPRSLLEHFTNEITKAFPESPYLKSKSLDTHFF